SVQSKTHVGGRASNLLTFFGSVSPGEQDDLVRVMPDGTLHAFELPKGSVLVVTDLIVSVNGSPSAGVTRGGLINPSGFGNVYPSCSFDATQQPQVAIQLTGGAVWSVVPEVINADNSADPVFVEVHGYLAKDK